MTNSVITAFPETSWQKHVLENYAYARFCQAFPDFFWIGVAPNVESVSWRLSVVMSNKRAFSTTISHDLKNLETSINEFITEIQLSI